LVLLLWCAPLGAHAQAPVTPTPAAVTTVRPPLRPGQAFLQSLLVPGLAQAKLDRPAGILFVATELIAVTMYAKSTYDYQTARAFSRDSTPLTYVVDPSTGLPQRDPDTQLPVVATWSSSRYTEGRVRARRSHIEDWVALIIFNHLFAGADAFVAAQLWDLPGKVDLQVAPRGSRVGWSIPW
jgi:hypothetical protein